MHFQVTEEDHIRTSHEPGRTETDGNSFASERELQELASEWPMKRLVEIWNRLPGVQPVTRFTDRKTAVGRIWRALQPQADSLTGGKAFSDSFHIFGVNWTPGFISFYADRKEYSRVKRSDLPAAAPWVFDHPFFLILNLAIGGNWPGNPDNTTIFPQDMLIDWVKVWKK